CLTSVSRPSSAGVSSGDEREISQTARGDRPDDRSMERRRHLDYRFVATGNCIRQCNWCRIRRSFQSRHTNLTYVNSARHPGNAVATHMSDERRKHGWPFWFAVVLIVVPVLYVASFGPACWLMARLDHPDWLVGLLDTIYVPITTCMKYLP